MQASYVARQLCGLLMSCADFATFGCCAAVRRAVKTPFSACCNTFRQTGCMKIEVVRHIFALNRYLYQLFNLLPAVLQTAYLRGHRKRRTTSIFMHEPARRHAQWGRACTMPGQASRLLGPARAQRPVAERGYASGAARNCPAAERVVLLGPRASRAARGEQAFPSSAHTPPESTRNTLNPR